MKSLLFLGVAVLCSASWGAEFKIRPDRADGIYQAGDSVTWSIETIGLEEGENAPEQAKYKVRSNGLDIVEEGVIDLQDGEGEFTATREDAGSLILFVDAPDVAGIAGAAFSPETITPVISKPKDFDAFWAQKLKVADAIDLNPVLTPEESPREDVDMWQVSLDNINGTKVRGQLARPKDADGKLPALLIVQWAGVYPLHKSWASAPASSGWLTLNILAHDLPVYEPDSYYAERKKNELNDYPGIGNDDREESYFLRMYLGCYQAVRYLQSRPDWDGKILMVRGNSQGGMQSLVTAALCNDVVTGVAVNVPAGCDLNGPVGDHRPGWPQWYYKVKGRDAEQVRRTAEYFDVVNFASDIKCPALIGVGLADMTCPAPGVYAAINQIQGPVEIVPMPASGHRATDVNPHTPFYDARAIWMNELKIGQNPLAVTAE